jgi:hypothetical protein
METATLARKAGLLALGILLVWGLLPAARVAADEDPPQEERDEAKQETSREVSDERARELADLLSKAAKKKDAADVIPALEEVEGLSHPEFHKPLLKLLSHRSSEVALKAADVLCDQRLDDEKEAGKLAKAVWKQGWQHKANDGRWVVRGRALRAMAQISPEPLATNDLKDVEKMWRAVTGSANKELAPVLADICAYVLATGDKRLCRVLAEEIDEPTSTSPNAANNPPASWWEGRWHLWNQVKGDVHAALKQLTGQTFKTTEEAKAWFEANEREFGFKW